jgi:hypothetical protein
MRLVIDKKYMRVKAKITDGPNVEKMDYANLKVEDIHMLSFFIPNENEMIVHCDDIIDYKPNNIFEGDKIEITKDGKCRILKEVDIQLQYNYVLGKDIKFKNKTMIVDRHEINFDERLTTQEKKELEKQSGLKILHEDKNEMRHKKMISGEIGIVVREGERKDFLSNYIEMIDSINERCFYQYEHADIIATAKLKDGLKKGSLKFIFDKYRNVIITDAT